MPPRWLTMQRPVQPKHREATLYGVMRVPQRCRYNAGMPVAITVRNVPNEVRDELAARAARSGRSLQEFLLVQLREVVAHPDPDDVIERARRRVALTSRGVGPTDIIGALDADRR